MQVHLHFSEGQNSRNSVTVSTRPLSSGTDGTDGINHRYSLGDPTWQNHYNRDRYQTPAIRYLPNFPTTADWVWPGHPATVPYSSPYNPYQEVIIDYQFEVKPKRQEVTTPKRLKGKEIKPTVSGLTSSGNPSLEERILELEKLLGEKSKEKRILELEKLLEERLKPEKVEVEKPEHEKSKPGKVRLQKAEPAPLFGVPEQPRSESISSGSPDPEPVKPDEPDSKLLEPEPELDKLMLKMDDPKPAGIEEDKPKEDKPKEDKPKEDKPKEDKLKEDKPKEDKPKEEKPKEDKPKEDKPKEDKLKQKDPAPKVPKLKESKPDKPKRYKSELQSSELKPSESKPSKLKKQKYLRWWQDVAFISSLS